MAVLVVATTLTQMSQPQAAAATVAETGVEGFVPIAPRRVYETRVGQPGHVGRGALGPQETVTVAVASLIGVAPERIGGVAVTVTVTQPQAAGYITVWPGGARPTASNLNFVGSQTIANSAVVGVDASGNFQLFHFSGGSSHVIVDVTGWVPKASGYQGVSPIRVLETRAGLPGYGGQGQFGAGEERSVAIASRLTVPAGRRVTAITANLTVAGAARPGYLTMYPGGQSRPPTSSINFVAGQVVANSAVLGVGADGTVKVFSFVAGTDVVLDVTGYFLDDLTFQGMAPVRLTDTRTGSGAGVTRVSCSSGNLLAAHGRGPLLANTCYQLDVSALGGVPYGLTGMVSLNLTIAGSRAEGFLTVWPSSSQRPVASSINFTPGNIIASTVIVGVDDRVTIFNGSTGTTDLVADVTGWFPQDALGLVADGREMRRYSSGNDPMGVVVCQKFADRGSTIDSIMTRLNGPTADYYETQSGGRYRPTFTLIATVIQRNDGDPTDDDCEDNFGPVVVPNGYRGVVLIVPTIRGNQGLASPGNSCDEVTCTFNNDVNETGRFSYFTSGTIDGDAPYWSYVVHEFGHTLNWPHSYSGLTRGCKVGFEPYDNPADVMSGTPKGCERDPQNTPQGTLAFNRYAAGWIPVDQVKRHSGGTVTYEIGPVGSSATQMIVVPSRSGLAFTTIEARAKVPSVTHDNALIEGGVMFNRIDQRKEVNCGAGATRCSGIVRRQQQYPASSDRGTATNPNRYDGVLNDTGDAAIDLGGVTARLTRGWNGSTYQIEVSGSIADFVPVPRITSPGARRSDSIGTTERVHLSRRLLTRRPAVRAADVA